MLLKFMANHEKWIISKSFQADALIHEQSLFLVFIDIFNNANRCCSTFCIIRSRRIKETDYRFTCNTTICLVQRSLSIFRRNCQSNRCLVGNEIFLSNTDTDFDRELFTSRIIFNNDLTNNFHIIIGCRHDSDIRIGFTSIQYRWLRKLMSLSRTLMSSWWNIYWMRIKRKYRIFKILKDISKWLIDKRLWLIRVVKFKFKINLSYHLTHSLLEINLRLKSCHLFVLFLSSTLFFVALGIERH